MFFLSILTGLSIFNIVSLFIMFVGITLDMPSTIFFLYFASLSILGIMYLLDRAITRIYHYNIFCLNKNEGEKNLRSHILYVLISLFVIFIGNLIFSPSTIKNSFYNIGECEYNNEEKNEYLNLIHQTQLIDPLETDIELKEIPNNTFGYLRYIMDLEYLNRGGATVSRKQKGGVVVQRANEKLYLLGYGKVYNDKLLLSASKEKDFNAPFSVPLECIKSIGDKRIEYDDGDMTVIELITSKTISDIKIESFLSSIKDN